MPAPPPQKQPSAGRCSFCGGRASRGAMRRHLESCEARVPVRIRGGTVASAPALHLLVEGVENPDYWLHLEAAPTAALQDLDLFLRRVWLECCGHLSAFKIAGTTYASCPDDEWDLVEEPLTPRVAAVLPPGAACDYEYDYGSTTELWIRSLAEIPQRTGRRRIVLLARNERPEFRCVLCGGGPAVRVCTVCRGESGGWLCEECVPVHTCGEEMLSPLVNSPRAGVCGYPIEW